MSSTELAVPGLMDQTTVNRYKALSNIGVHEMFFCENRGNKIIRSQTTFAFNIGNHCNVSFIS